MLLLLTSPRPAPDAHCPAVHHGWAQDGIEIHTWDVFSHGQSEPFEADSRAFIPDYQHLVGHQGPHLWCGLILLCSLPCHAVSYLLHHA